MVRAPFVRVFAGVTVVAQQLKFPLRKAQLFKFSVPLGGVGNLGQPSFRSTSSADVVKSKPDRFGNSATHTTATVGLDDLDLEPSMVGPHPRFPYVLVDVVPAFASYSDLVEAFLAVGRKVIGSRSVAFQTPAFGPGLLVSDFRLSFAFLANLGRAFVLVAASAAELHTA